jgi:predicted MPP superfamily phosphohydrolase
MYVSRGLGTVLVRARLGAPPEIPVFELYLSGG